MLRYVQNILILNDRSDTLAWQYVAGQNPFIYSKLYIQNVQFAEISISLEINLIHELYYICID